jgi:hypothetical protein
MLPTVAASPAIYLRSQVAEGFQPCSRAGLAGLKGLRYPGAR